MLIAYIEQYTVWPRNLKSTLHFGRPLDPWIPVKQCSRPDGSAIQPILASPGQSETQAKPLASPRASNMRSKATPGSQNGPQKACPRTSHGVQMVSSWQSIESTNRPIIGSSSLGAGGRGRSPSDITYACVCRYIYMRKCEHITLL